MRKLPMGIRMFDLPAEVGDEAAKRAFKIVRKFPQIEQAVLAPMLLREIGHALLEFYEKGRGKDANV